MDKLNRPNFIPAFISRKHAGKESEGAFSGSVLISDMSGFTSLTESLFILKKKGAEQLSDILNTHFSNMISSVYSLGGFVVNLAGDALTAVFPGDNGEMAWRAACMIRKAVPQTVTVASGKHSTGIRSGIDAGEIDWNIYGSGPFTYLFNGRTVTNAAALEAEACAGEINMGTGIGELIYGMDPPDSGRVSDGESALKEEYGCIDREIEMQFVHPDYITRMNTPEFRDVASVFTGFCDIDDMNEFMDSVVRKSEEYGGYFNLLDCGDKGNLVLTLFGAPVTSERNTTRSVEYAQDLREKYGARLRSGITYGRVFAGFIGSSKFRGHYTVIGDKVNTAARLMESCNPGDIRISEGMGKELQERFQIDCFSNLLLKGSSISLSFCNLKGRRSVSNALSFDNRFIGRGRELDELQRFAARTLSENRTGALIISGEAGIGKTRLAYHAQSCLEGTRLIYLKCDEILSKSLNPIESFFEEVFGTSGSESREDSEVVFESAFCELMEGPGANPQSVFHAENLKRLKYVLKGFMGIDEGGEYSQLDAKSRFDNTILAFMHIIRLLAGDKRLYIIIDDFQWVDPDTISILDDLFRQIDFDNPILCILTRPSPIRDMSGLLPESAELLSIDLTALLEKDQQDLVRSILPCSPSETLSEIVENKAEGNPFYIEQIIMYLLDNQLLECADGIAELTSPGVQLPGSILDIIISRVDRLEADIRRTVKHASVLGRRFNIKVLSRMLTGRPLHKHLETGTEERIWTRLSEILYIFKHALIRDAVYEMQMDRQLRELHLLAGNIIEEIYAEDERMYSDLSYHFEKSNQMERMLKYTLKAAQYAFNNFRNREAIEMYGKYIHHEKDLHERKKAVFRQGEVFELTGNWDKSLDLYDESLEYARKSGEISLLLDALNRKGFLKHRMGDNQEALECFAEAEKEYERIDDSLGLASIYNNIGTVYIDRNNPEKAVFHLNRALSILDIQSNRSDFAERMMFTYNNLGLVHQKMNDLEKASEFYKKSMNIAKRINSRRNLAALNFGNIRYLQENVDEAEEYYRIAMNDAEKTGDRHLTRVLLNNLAAISTARGEYSKAIEIFRDALVLARSMNDRKGIRLLSQNIGEIHFYLGEYEASETAFNEAVQTALDLGDDRGIGNAMGKTGMMLFYNGELDRAGEMLKGGIKHSTKAGNIKNAHDYMYFLARIYIEHGDEEELLDILKRMKSTPEKQVSSLSRWYTSVIATFTENVCGNSEKTLELAKDITMRFPDTEGEAIARCIMFRLTGAEEQRKRALQVYQALYKDSPMAFYRDLIDSLR